MNRTLKTPLRPLNRGPRQSLGQQLRGAGVAKSNPLSFAQQRLWFLDQLEPDSPLYNISVLVRLAGRLNIRALEAALNAVVARHEALRTRFVRPEETPLQVIDPQLRVELRLSDLTLQSETAREPEAQKRIREEINRPFNLSAEPLLRASLFRLGPEEHQLLLVIHHIVADEWSLKVLFAELTELYQAELESRPAQIPELPMQYAEYAEWQRNCLTGEVLRNQLAYWRRQLGGTPPVTELPTDYPRRPTPSFSGGNAWRLLNPQLSRRIKELAQAHEATLFMVLLAALTTLLHRYTQQEDLIVCSPIAGRTRMETEGLIGFFVNTLPLRVNLAGDPSFLELLARVRELTLQAFEHQDVPFEKLVEELRPERSLSHMPFSRVMFVVQNNLLEKVQLPGLEIEFLPVEGDKSKFDTTLVVQEISQGLRIHIEYSSELFAQATIGRLLGHFETLLQGIATNPNLRLSELPLLSAEERQQILLEWNNTTTDYPRDKSIPEVFERQVELTPDATALRFGQQVVSYRELNARANQLARHLRQLKVGPDAPVGICMLRSADMVIGLLAILKAGGAYVPLDPTYPKERLAFMLEDVQAPVVLAQQALIAVLPKNASKVVWLDTDWELIARESRQNLPSLAGPESLAYVMYTSGSTGHPKGVAVPHRGVNRLVLNSNYIHLDATERVAQVSNISFDAATFEIWGALLNGGQLVGITSDIALSPRDFARELAERGITAMFLTSALFSQLASEAPGAFAGLRTLIAGGEALDPKWVRAVLKQSPPGRLVNGYGPTENTTFTCCQVVEGLDEKATNVPIGRPIANTQVFILDAHLNPVPVGVAGELYAGGDGIASGYWNRPELTAQEFVPNPFSQDGPSFLYRTGDLARFLPDGTIEFLGRMDNQVKLRGFRIELGEIETVLSRHPAVRECVVIAVGDTTASRRLVAYLVSEVQPVPTASELRAFVSERLPDYMVPAAFVPMRALPLTPNGKVDRRALPAPDQARPELEREYAGPRDEVERQLVRIWEKVLEVSPIGIQDKFFDLGGHSLMAVRVIAQIERALGKKLRLATIFQAPTIEQLAAIIREEVKEIGVACTTSIVEVQAQGTRSPLYLVHGAGGGMFWGYVNLARFLGPDQPIYAFKSRGLDGGEELSRIEDLAAQYVADLRQKQPQGPYYLGGYCFGGNVAFEMARQLSTQNQTVAFVGLLNCAPPNSRYNQIPWTPRWGLRFAANLLYWANYFRQWSPTQRREFFRWKASVLSNKFAKFFHRRLSATQSFDAREMVDLSAYTQDQRKIWEAHIRGLVNFHPQPYSGQVHLFRSPGHPFWCSFDPDYGWCDLAKGGVSTEVVPGAHEKILEEPCVEIVAAKLRQALEQAQRQTVPEANVSQSNSAWAIVSQPHTLYNYAEASAAQARLTPSVRAARFESRELGYAELDVRANRLGRYRQSLGVPPELLVGVRLNGNLNVAALEQSLGELTRWQEALRAVFSVDSGDLSQCITQPTPIRLETIDLTRIPLPEREAQAVDLIGQEARRAAAGLSPVRRCLLLRLEEHEHWLALVLHEIALDNHSIRLLLNQLPKLYQAMVEGKGYSLPSCKTSYHEALKTIEALSPHEEAQHVTFWQKQLAGAPELLELPSDRPRPAKGSIFGARYPLQLPQGDLDRIGASGSSSPDELYARLLTVFAALLHRYTGATDIVIGSMSSTRRPEWNGLVGNFENPLALRCDLTGDPTFGELLCRVREVRQRALAHRALGFADLVERLQPHRNASYWPVFQVMLRLEDSSLPATQAAGVSFAPFAVDCQTSNYDLNLRLERSASGLNGWIEYSTALFESARIGRMAQHFVELFRAGVGLPDTKVSVLPLLPEEEKRRLLVEWAATEKPYPTNKSLVDLFHEQVMRTPEAEAVETANLRLTYRQLANRANQIARHLRNLGVVGESLVGICLERSCDLVAAILGALRAGAAYVPLDPAYPAERLGFIANDAQLRVIVTQSKLLNVLPKTDAAIVCLDTIASASDDTLDCSACGPGHHALAYVIYTSGSTGKPKGVALEHRGAVALVHWAKEVFTGKELAGVLASTSICFDLSVFEMFVPLSWGGKVIMAENALALASLPAANEVTLINTVPSAICELVRINAVPPSVKVVNLAGEPLATELVDQIYAETSVGKVYDLYGPTETTTYSTFTLRQPGKPPSIGRPLTNEQVYLFDPNRQLVPIGIPGELYIGGVGLGRGYLNRPELTAEKFIPHPFKTGERLYRTGDLARWRPDGNLEYLGRIDHQVKIRGFRIELGEIETALKEDSRVTDAVVLAREDYPGEKRLVAYVVPATSPLEADTLRAKLRETLPEHMMPSAFVFLQDLPMTPNGKVDRKALPVPDAQAHLSEREFIAPRTAIEEKLATLWREVLHLNRVSIEHNFFDLGGHSLTAIRLLSRVREILKVELPLSSIFTAPTIASFAEGLGSGRWTQDRPPMLPIEPAPREGRLPVSFVQERLWFLDQLEPGSHAYNVPIALRLHGELNSTELEQAINTVVSRHESLRTSFSYAEGTLAQIIAPTCPLKLQILEAPGQGQQAERQAQELVNQEAQRPFDLSRSPLVWVSLIRLSHADHVLVLVMHHTISDGWSLALFLQELATLYGASSTDSSAPVLPELSLQYVDYAYWERQCLHGKVLEHELDYWRTALAGAPTEVKLPTDRPMPEQPTRRAQRRDVLLDNTIAAGIAELGRAEACTPFIILMTALQLTLHKWTGQEDLVVGTVVAGRNRRELENLIGCFMNFLPIRARLHGAETGRQLLQRVRTAVLESQSHQECPFEKIVEAINPRRRQNQNPLYNVALLLQNFPPQFFVHDQIRASRFPVSMQAALLDLRFEAEHTTEGLSLTCEYKTDLFEPETIDQLLAAHKQILRLLLASPDASLSEFKLTKALENQAQAARAQQQKPTVAIAGTFTCEPVAEPLEYWLRQLELPASITFAPYNQLFQQLLNPASLLATNPLGLNVVLLRPEDWARSGQTSAAEGQQELEQTAADFIAAIKTAAARSSTPYLVCFCPPSIKPAQDRQHPELLAGIEHLVCEGLRPARGIYLLTSAEFAKWYPVRDYYDATADELGHLPYTPVFFTGLATAVARKFHALSRPAHKAIVLDCDQTLWSGVCGEDGAKGIRLDGPRLALQQFMRAQREAGMLLCLCSKNNEQDVEDTFAQRLDMPLRREHFTACKLNWLPKSDNLKSLAEELALGLDSFIFIDDNPIECAEVEANCPEVLTLQLPENAALIPQFLHHCWVFDRLTVTEEDRYRAELYRQNQQREKLRSEAPSLGDFLAGLELKVSINPIVQDQWPRVAQLTQRTNQFNWTTRRYTESQLAKILTRCQALTVHVSDRFGDYGLVGAMIFAPAQPALEVDSFLLSCRVLGRGVEHQMLATLGELARKQCADWVDVHFIPTEKNRPALDFLEGVGSAFRQPLNGGYVFRFPAAYAAEVVFQPSASTPHSKPAEPVPSRGVPAGSRPARKFSACRTIALESNDAAKIHQRIQATAKVRTGNPTNFVAPRTELEQSLCALWANLLRVERVGLQDDFFQLGGHSLLAVRVFAEVEKLTGRKFPLVTLFQAPTVAQLAAILAGGVANATPNLLVPIRPQGSRPPLFLIHGAGGDVLWGYANLAQHLPPDQPVFGIKSRGQAGLDEYSHLPEMAQCYLQVVRQRQPQGPYYLGGYCFGGNVAYEMARQLRDQGQEVALVALLDSAPANAGYENFTWWRPSFVWRFSRNLGYWLKDFASLSHRDRLSFFNRKTRAFGRKLIRRLRRGAGPAPVDIEEVIDPSHIPAHELSLWQIHLQALTDHLEKPYSGRIVLLRTRGQPLFCSLEDDFCWGNLARGSVKVVLVPGSHESVFIEPNVQCLGKELSRLLAEAQNRSPAPVTTV